MKRWSAIGLLLVCVIVLAIAWFLAVERSATRSDAARSSPAETEPATELSLSDDAVASALRELAPAAEPPASVEPEPIGGSADGFELRVLLHETGEPVPDADVFVTELAANAAQVSFYSDPLGGLDDIEAHGTRYTADAQGRVALPFTARRALVYAEHDRYAGFVHLGSESELPPDIYLHEDASLTVQVVDETGAPLSGVEVVLGWEGDGRFPRIVRSATTAGENGTVELTRVGLLLGVTGDSLVSARIRALLEPPVEVRVDRLTLSRGAVVLVMPATGSLELLLRDKDGIAWPDPLDIDVHAELPGREVHSPWDGHRVSLRGVRGRVVVPRVALGTHVFARATLPDGGRADADTAGPTVAGETRSLVLEIPRGPDAPVLEGRLLEDGGKPLANCNVAITAAIGTPLRLRNHWNPVTDARGVFRQRAEGLREQSGTVRLFVARRNPNGSLGASTSTDIVAPLEVGTTRLGDLVLREGPMICAGRVVDDQGRAVARADVSLHQSGPYVGFHASQLRTETDGEGRFSIHGFIEVASLFVFARARGFGESSVETVPLRDDLVLVLGAAGKIVGSLAPSKQFRMDELAIGCVSTRFQGNRAFSSRVTPAHGSGSFQFTGLAAGEFRVQLFTHPMVGAPVDLGTIRVSAGEETRDPRLQAIDVDSELHRFEIQARAIDGRALPFSLRARVVGAEEDFDWRGDAYDGSFRVASVSPEIEVLVSATGFRTITAICRPGITSVVLPPALAIQLSIDGVADWLGSSFELVPMLVHRERGDNENEQALAFDREGKCRFTVSNPGEHEVWFRIRANGGRTGEGFASDPPERIDVRDTSERQTFQVHLARESAPLLRIEDLKDELLRGAIK